MNGIFKRRAGPGASDRQVATGLRDLGFEPPRRGAGLPSNHESPQAEALGRAPADADPDSIAELQRLNDRPERAEADYARTLAEVARRAEDAQSRVAATAERQLVAALEEQREELETETRREVEEARRAGEAALRAREHELGLELAAIKAELATTREELASARHRIASMERRPPRPARVRLSTASFGELRALGLSITQANHVLRYRDEHGFSSLDDLDRVPGLPLTSRTELKQAMAP